MILNWGSLGTLGSKDSPTIVTFNDWCFKAEQMKVLENGSAALYSSPPTQNYEKNTQAIINEF